MITRKIMIVMANAVNEYEEPIKGKLTQIFIDICSESNPRFNEARFRKACETTKED